MAADTVIFGLHAARHALEQSPESVIEIHVQENKRESRSVQRVLELAGNLNVQYVKKEVLDRLSGYQRHQGIVIRRKAGALSQHGELPDRLAQVVAGQGIVLVLDGVQDPHNLGACLRTADAAGVSAVVVPRDRAVGVNATVSKVAAGAAENVPVYPVTNMARTLREMQAAGLWVIGTSDAAPDSLYAAELDRPLVLVFGAEGKGLRENTARQCDMLVHIPMQGIVESLNISVACGICLYEAVRQRSRHAS